MGQGFLLADPAATLFIAGVLWTMNYPLLGLVGDDAFPAYEGAHNRRFGMVVLPGVTIAAASTIELVADRAETIPLWSPATGPPLVLVAMASTVALQARRRARLAEGWGEALHRLLVQRTGSASPPRPARPACPCGCVATFINQ